MNIIKLIKSWFSVKNTEFQTKNLGIYVCDLETKKKKAVATIYDKLILIKTSLVKLQRKRAALNEEIKKYESLTQKALKEGKEQLAQDFAYEYDIRTKQYEMLNTGISNVEVAMENLLSKQNEIIRIYDNKISNLKIRMANLEIKEELISISDMANITNSDSFSSELKEIEELLNSREDTAAAIEDINSKFSMNDSIEESLSKFEISIDKTEALNRFKAEHNI